METLALTVGLPFGLIVVNMSALISLYATYLRDEELSAEVLLFVHRLGLACVGVPTVLVTFLAAASFAHTTPTVLIAIANALALTAVVPGITWSAHGRPRRCAGYFQAPGTIPPHGSW